MALVTNDPLRFDRLLKIVGSIVYTLPAMWWAIGTGIGTLLILISAGIICALGYFFLAEYFSRED